MPKKHPGYPFVPKTVRWLQAGDFWALPLSDGTFGCGRVIDVPTREMELGTMMFLAGVLDWHASHEPTSATIAGAPCLTQGIVHLRAITRSGSPVLGFRELALDGISPWMFRGAEFWRNSFVHLGLTPTRPQTPDDDALPTLSSWGYDVARGIADDRFVKKSGIWARPT